MTPYRWTAALALACSCLPAAPLFAQRSPAAGATARAAPRPPTCRVDGTWELASVSVDGKERALSGYQQRKILTGGHFMWLGQAARRDTILRRTVADSLRATTVLGGSGSYTVSGSAYTERLDYFYDPNGIGQTVPATCRVDGEYWYHSFTTPFDSLSVPADKRQHIVEVWRRVP